MTPLRPGDVIAFADGDTRDLVAIAENFVSDGIQAVTHSPLTHVAMVWAFDFPINGAPQRELYIIESTIRNGVNGVQLNPLAQRLGEAKRVAGLLLSARVRAFLDFNAMWHLGAAKLGDRYDVAEIGAYLARHIPILEEIPALYQPTAGAEVCSELVAMLLRAGGLPGLRPATMPPQAIAELRIYEEQIPLAGDPIVIPNFNTV